MMVVAFVSVPTLVLQLVFLSILVWRLVCVVLAVARAVAFE